VRELENRVQRGVILARDTYLRPEDLELAESRVEGITTLQAARDEAERRLLVESLTRNAGNVTRAARDIDVSRPTLHDLMRKHGIDASRFRQSGSGFDDEDVGEDEESGESDERSAGPDDSSVAPGSIQT
jgi:DNA-binding NtrC family response regulator